MNASTAPVCAPGHPAGDESRLVLVAFVTGSASRGHHPHRTRGRRGSIRDGRPRGPRHFGAPSIRPVTSRTGQLGGLRDVSEQLLDHLVAGVVAGGRGRPGQLGPDRRREVPVDRAARRSWRPGRSRRRIRTTAAPRPARRSRCAPVGPALLEIERERQHSPVVVGDDAGQRVGARQRPGLGP